MKTAKNHGNAMDARSPVLDFLSGNGKNPVSERVGRASGPLETEFVKGVQAEVAAQDRENEKRSGQSAVEELTTLLRLMGDNREMIEIIKQATCESVSELATHMGRELSNVSRTLSKMAAYGLVGFERDEERRAKKPVWILPIPKGAGADWVEAYCLARAMRAGGIASLEPGAFAATEVAVQSVVAAAAAAFDQIASPAKSKMRSQGAVA